MFCQKCGLQVPENAKFCNKCGQSLNQSETVANMGMSLNSNNLSKHDFLRHKSLMRCKSCGTWFGSNEMACPKCGKKTLNSFVDRATGDVRRVLGRIALGFLLAFGFLMLYRLLFIYIIEL